VITDDHVQRFFQSGSAKLFLPKTYEPTIEAVFVNTAGGLADGDRFEYRVAAQGKTHLTVTTQTAERVYGAVGAEPASLSLAIDVDDGAICHWLPQETIFFNRARLNRKLTVSMDKTASFLANEIMVFGRQAMNETVTCGTINDQWRIWRAGRLLHAEAVRLDGAISEMIAPKAAADEYICLATCLFVSPDAESNLQLARDFFAKQMPVQAAISAWDGKLVVRCLAAESASVKRVMSGFLGRLRHFALPRVWNC